MNKETPTYNFELNDEDYEMLYKSKEKSSRKKRTIYWGTPMTFNERRNLGSEFMKTEMVN
jgi:hypothetical protein